MDNARLSVDVDETLACVYTASVQCRTRELGVDVENLQRQKNLGLAQALV